MNWVRSNPFLAGLVSAVVVLGGGLGWLIWSASDRLAEVDERYEKQQAEFQRLTTLAPFPDPTNVTKVGEQKKAYAESVKKLEEQVAAFEPAAETLDPAGFQDRLRKNVTEVVAKAKAAGVRVPDDFYLGFERYRAELPPEKAVPLLARELAAIRGVVHTLLESGIDAIPSIRRAPLPHEPGATTAAAVPSAPTPGPKKAPAPELVTRHPFDIVFTAEHGAFRRGLARLMEQRPIVLVRGLRVKNEKEKGPLRGPEIAKADPSTAPGPNASASKPAAPATDESVLRYVVGQEHLEATLRIEMIRFVPASS